MLIVFTVLVEQLERKRYLDSLELTEEQEKILLNVDGIIIEDYGEGGRVYALSGYYK
ncbi:hypothetical protein HOC13_00470 [Candidatus Woesearchaeota archaeon]|nr:hypothetical protein [Candidatus Woesearchaeota archaeon]